MAGYKLKDLQYRLETAKRRWAPWICVTVREDVLLYRQLQADGWQAIAPVQAAQLTLFAKVVLLMPTRYCSFKACRFPVHLVTEKELPEAVGLDFEKWSPWGKQSSHCFSHHQLGDEWQVNIWVWDTQAATRLQQQVERCTHIIPEPAWLAASVPENPSLLIATEEETVYYALIDAAGWVQKLAQVQNQGQAQRYWHGWGTPPIKHCWITAADAGQWYPEAHAPELIPATAVAHTRLLNLTRLPGVQDWTDPMSFRGLISVAAVMWLLWMLADFSVLNYQQEQVQQQLQLIRKSANHALALREQVKGGQQLFQQIQGLRYKQQLPEYLIAQLSQKIPNDIWLDALQLQENALDISGRGKQVVHLLPILEQIKGITQVQLLNDVHPDPATGEELFQIRLILAGE
ncbi:MAG: PilN domain-containing protein [Methylovulum sp.]|nr:PilN domain-containing protein [Methylovulum sp.]